MGECFVSLELGVAVVEVDVRALLVWPPCLRKRAQFQEASVVRQQQDTIGWPLCRLSSNTDGTLKIRVWRVIPRQTPQQCGARREGCQTTVGMSHPAWLVVRERGLLSFLAEKHKHPRRSNLGEVNQIEEVCTWIYKALICEGAFSSCHCDLATFHLFVVAPQSPVRNWAGCKKWITNERLFACWRQIDNVLCLCHCG